MRILYTVGKFVYNSCTIDKQNQIETKTGPDRPLAQPVGKTRKGEILFDTKEMEKEVIFSSPEQL
jgi:hypothetical protein